MFHPAASSFGSLSSLARDLSAAAIAVPDGFEERLIERLRQDRTLLELLDLGFFSAGRALIELINLLLSLLPAPQPAV